MQYKLHTIGCLAILLGFSPVLLARRTGSWISTARHDTAVTLSNLSARANEIELEFRHGTRTAAVLEPGQSIRFLASAIEHSGSGRIQLESSDRLNVTVTRIDLENNSLRRVFEGVIQPSPTSRRSRNGCQPNGREVVYYTVRDANEDGIPDPETWATVLVKDSCGMILDAAAIYPGMPGAISPRGAEDRLDVEAWCGSFTIELGDGCSARSCTVTTTSGLTGRLISADTTWDVLCHDSAAFTDDSPSAGGDLELETLGRDFYDNCWAGAASDFRQTAPLIIDETTRIIERSFKRVLAAQVLSLTMTIVGAATGAPVVGVIAETIDTVSTAQELLDALGFDMTPTLSEAFNRRWGSGCQLLSAESLCRDRAESLFGVASYSPVSVGQMDALLRSENLNVRGVRNNCPN